MRIRSESGIALILHSAELSVASYQIQYQEHTLVRADELVMMIAMHWNRPFAKGLAVTALFDRACCVIFALYLAGV